MQIYTNS